MRAHIAAGGSSQGKKQTGPEKIKKDKINTPEYNNRGVIFPDKTQNFF